MRIFLLRKDSIHLSGGVQPLQAAPKGLGTWETVAFSSQVTADASHHVYRLSQRRRLFRRNRRFVDIATQRFPFDILEKHRARHFRHLSTQHGQMINAPGHNHINAKTCFETISAAQLTVLNAAATFQRPMVDLNAPTSRIPFHPLLSIFKAFYRYCGQKHPFNRAIRPLLQNPAQSHIRPRPEQCHQRQERLGGINCTSAKRTSIQASRAFRDPLRGT